MHKAIALLAMATLMALAAGTSLAQDFYVRGSYYEASNELGIPGAWGCDSGNLLVDDGTNGDVVAGDGIFSRLVTPNVAGTQFELKAGVTDWSENFPNSNVQIFLSADNEPFLVTFDRNTYADGFLPAANIVYTPVHYQPVTGWFVVGGAPEIGDFDAASSVAATATTGGLVRAEVFFTTTGTINWKFIADQTYGPIEASGFGFQGGGFDNATVESAGGGYAFVLNPANGRVKSGPAGTVAAEDQSFSRVKSLYRD